MCDYVIREDKIDIAEVMPGEWGPTTHRVYCQRAAQFWVQSLLSTHNSHACAHHLARIVREIDHAAAQFEITTIERKPDMRYARHSQSGAHMKMTKEDSNYAHVTVKPYSRKVR